MKKMKTTIAATVALAACASTQLFAQNIKEDTITFSVSIMQQTSVSTSKTVANAGNFSAGPMFYKTKTFKATEKDILADISAVMHNGKANFYSSKAKLVLVQGELGGFWNITDAAAQSYADLDEDGDNSLPGTFNDDGYDTGASNFGAWYDDSFDPANSGYDENLGGTVASLNGVEDTAGDPTTWDPDDAGIIFPTLYVDVLSQSGVNNYTDFATYLYGGNRFAINDGLDAGGWLSAGAEALLDSGRHFLPVPFQKAPSTDDGSDWVMYPTSGQYPVGHMQPWGQIFVKDPGANGYSADSPLCENVTFFFCLAVEECYDCFYLNSFITDANFTSKPGAATGPPCCTSPNLLLGTGVDKYYMSLTFDNTDNNPYLNNWTDNNNNNYYYYHYVGYKGISVSFVSSTLHHTVADGLTPDLLIYVDSIRSRLGTASPYECRFTLNGIVTYNWALKLLNVNDAAADFIGTAKFDANGFGFIQLACSLLTGTVTFTEKAIKDIGCCDDTPWWDNWYGPGSAYRNDYGSGYENGFGYYNPARDQFDAYPFFNVVGGEYYDNGLDSYRYLPDQFESPLNPGAALTYHNYINCCGVQSGYGNMPLARP